MNEWTRRDFTKSVILAGATTALGAARAAGAGDRVRLGCIGLGNRGDQVLDAFLKQPDAEVAAVSDLSQAYMDFAARKAGTSPRQFKDYRRLLELKDLDAVVIATPDHWHALQTIEACQAGKDVYVEKPLSLSVMEGRRMVEAVRRHGRVCQVGIHRRSAPVCQEATEFVRKGGLGKVTAARALPHPQRMAGRDWQSAGRKTRPRTLIGMRGWVPPRGGPTIRTAPFTVSDGSTITAAARSPTSVCITWISFSGRWARRRPSRLPPWAARPPK